MTSAPSMVTITWLVLKDIRPVGFVRQPIPSMRHSAGGQIDQVRERTRLLIGSFDLGLVLAFNA